ncbi:MAG: hypothetical protein ABJC63_15565, partial [Gemmatimonadales bacterium]
MIFAQRWSRRFPTGEGRSRNGRCSRKTERESRAGAQLARKREIARHQAGKIAADRKTQASAAIAAGLRAVELNERLEHSVELVGCNARPCVAHFGDHPIILAIHRHFDHVALLCELDRVRKKIEKDLLDFFRITNSDAARNSFEQELFQEFGGESRVLFSVSIRAIICALINAMTYICISITDPVAHPLEQLAPAILKVAPRLSLDGRKGQIWADGKSLQIDIICGDLIAVLEHKGVINSQIGASRIPITAEVASRLSAPNNRITHIPDGEESK